MLKLIEQVNLYARGLALAEGTIHCGGSLRYHMSRAAESVLSEIYKYIQLGNGVRFKKQGSVYLTLPGKGWWKKSLRGLDKVHAFRGYIEGDGCWSHSKVGYKYNGVCEQNRYIYPYLKIYVAEKEAFICDWIRECLQGFKYYERKELTQTKRSYLFSFNVKGKECDRLFVRLYENSVIDFKRGFYSYPRVVRERVKVAHDERGRFIGKKEEHDVNGN